MSNQANQHSADPSFFWYDLETTGVQPKWDRITQFAGLRTDADLNVIGDETVTYASLAIDVLPNPESTVVTGITPETLAAHGEDEWRLLGRINELFAKPGTCTVGYNSLRFDDEFMRYGLYRTLRDPYAREWQNGNSRWDIIDLVRATGALRPEGIEWPHVDGQPVYKLEALTAENGIDHGNAHDALSDVHATVALAKLIKEKQPRLFDYYFSIRSKRAVKRMLEPMGTTPIVHVTAMYPKERYGTAVVLPLCPHPFNANAVVVVDLCADPGPLLSWSADKIRDNLFKKGAEERPPLKEIRLNRCPFVAPLNTLTRAAQKRLGIDVAQCEENARTLTQAQLGRKIERVYLPRDDDDVSDVEGALYLGFLTDPDRRLCQQFQQSLEQGQWPEQISFQDERLNELKQRLKARSFPHLLDEAEQQRWAHFVRGKLEGPSEGWLTLPAYRDALAGLDPAKHGDLIESLSTYGDQIGSALGL